MCRAWVCALLLTVVSQVSAGRTTTRIGISDAEVGTLQGGPDSDASHKSFIPYGWHLSDIRAISGSEKKKAVCPEGRLKIIKGYQSTQMIKDPTQLNKGIQGPWVYMCKDRAPAKDVSAADPIDGLMCHHTDLKIWRCPPGWQNIGPTNKTNSSTNFNEGVGGKQIRCCFRRAHEPVKQIVANLKFIIAKSSKDPPCPEPFIDIYGSQRVNLNEGAGGKRIFMCMRMVTDPRWTALQKAKQDAWYNWKPKAVGQYNYTGKTTQVLTGDIGVVNAPDPNAWNYKKASEDWIGKCQTGELQSPINFHKSELIIPPALQLGVKKSAPSRFMELYDTRRVMATRRRHGRETGMTGSLTPNKKAPELSFRFPRMKNLKLKNTGKAVELRIPQDGRLPTTSFRGALYGLRHVTFRVPSEHTIKRKHKAAEMQFVHTQVGKESHYLIVSMLLDVPENKSASTQTDNLFKDIEMLKVPRDHNAAEVLVASDNYFHTDRLLQQRNGTNPLSFLYYKGSLTTPPCSEGVDWLVRRDVIPMSKLYTKELTAIFQNKLVYAGAGNIRALQKRNDRTIEQVTAARI